MENVNNKENKKNNIFYDKEKELFLRILKDKNDNLHDKKIYNKYLNKLKCIINNGLVLLDKTEIVKENKEKNRNLLIANNNPNNKNASKNNINKTLKKIEILKKSNLIQNSLPTSPNRRRTINIYFKEKNEIKKNLFFLNDRNTRRIQSSYTQREKNNNKNNYFKLNSIFQESSKYLNISKINKSKKLTILPNSNHKKEKLSNIYNFSTNNSFKINNALFTKTNSKPFLLSSSKKTEENLFHKKFKVEKSVKKAINKTILKYDKNKLKIYSNKKIKKSVQKLCENKKNIKNKKSMKEYYNIKEIFDEVVKKKRRSTTDFKRSSLFQKKMINKKNLFFKKTFKRYFSGPTREMKAELSKYIKNRHFIVDADNNPYKFKIFNSMHIF